MSDAPDTERITCPLCQTVHVRIVTITQSLVICVCEDCAAQIIIANRRQGERVPSASEYPALEQACTARKSPTLRIFGPHRCSSSVNPRARAVNSHVCVARDVSMRTA